MDSYERVGGEEFIHVPLQELLLPLLLFFLCVIKGRAAVSAQPKTISKFSHFPKGLDLKIKSNFLLPEIEESLVNPTSRGIWNASQVWGLALEYLKINQNKPLCRKQI